MAKGMIFAAALVLAAGGARAASPTLPVPLDAPSVAIGNGLIKARIYLVDSQKGFYRGQRFDQAGVVGSLTFGGQEFYGPWFDRVARAEIDYPYTAEGVVSGPASAISGPVEEFAPSGYDRAEPGGTFLKIGVGRLKKPDNKDYDHARTYDVADPGKWTVTATPMSVTFTQDVAGGFHYVKILRLVPGKPQMRIEHELTNTGAAPITANVYDHNFLRLGPGNGDVVARFPYPITPDIAPDAALARVEGNRFFFTRPLKGTERVAFLISGFGNGAKDYDVDIENAKTGAGVRVTGDDRLVRLYTWSIRTVMAVEPFVGIDLAPGASKRWAYTYAYRAPR
jgi:hypothetical protein